MPLNTKKWHKSTSHPPGGARPFVPKTPLVMWGLRPVYNFGENGGYGAAGGSRGSITGPSTGYSITQTTTVLSGPGGNGGSGLFKAIFYL